MFKRQSYMFFSMWNVSENHFFHDCYHEETLGVSEKCVFLRAVIDLQQLYNNEETFMLVSCMLAFIYNYYGREYYIDDDWETIQFPSFELLNSYLDEADSIYQAGGEIEAKHAAAASLMAGTPSPIPISTTASPASKESF